MLLYISQLLSPVLTSCVLDGEDMVGDDAVNPPPRPHLHHTRGELAALWCLFNCLYVLAFACPCSCVCLYLNSDDLLRQEVLQPGDLETLGGVEDKPASSPYPDPSDCSSPQGEDQLKQVRKERTDGDLFWFPLMGLQCRFMLTSRSC